MTLAPALQVQMSNLRLLVTGRLLRCARNDATGLFTTLAGLSKSHGMGKARLLPF